MTPRQADRLIASGETATFRERHGGGVFCGTVLSRDRYNVRIAYATGYGPSLPHYGLFDRGDLELVIAATLEEQKP